MTFSICGCYTCLFLVKFRLASTKRYCAGSPEGQIPFLPSWCNIHCTSSQKIKVNDTSSLAIPSSVAGLLTQGPPKLPSFRHSLKFKGTLAMFLMVSPLGISTSPYINPGISGMGRADFQCWWVWLVYKDVGKWTYKTQMLFQLMKIWPVTHRNLILYFSQEHSSALVNSLFTLVVTEHKYHE